MNAPVLSREHDAVAQVFRTAGAVSPAEARPLEAMPGVDLHAVVALATRGIVREAAPGHYHLFTGTVYERRQQLQTGVLTGAGIVAAPVGLPVVVWLLRE